MFLSLPDAETAVARVAERVPRGGHQVPEGVIRRRYVAGLRNLFALYLPLAESWQVFDNASLSGPRLIASRVAGQEATILEAEAFRRLEQHR